MENERSYTLKKSIMDQVNKVPYSKVKSRIISLLLIFSPILIFKMAQISTDKILPWYIELPFDLLIVVSIPSLAVYKSIKYAKYQEQIRTIYLTEILSNEFENVTYLAREKKIFEKFPPDWNDLEQFTSFDKRRVCTDFINVEYKGYPIKYVNIIDIDKNIKRKRGTYLEVTFPKKSYSLHQIISTSSTNRNSIKSNMKLKKLQTESLAFNELYNIYTSDAKEAYYLITPDLIIRILEFQAKYDLTFNFHFIENKLYVQTNRKKYVFLRLSKDYDQNYERIFNEIQLIKDIVNTFDENIKKAE